MKKADYYERCGIHPKWHKVTLAGFTNDLEAKDTVSKYVELCRDMRKKGSGLYLYGANGTGKTHLLMAAFKEMMAEGFICRVVTPAKIVAMTTAQWYNEDAKVEYNFQLVKPDFLAIEDLNKEYRPFSKGGTDESNRNLAVASIDNLLRARDQAGTPVWITSNLRPSGIEEAYSVDIASLLKGMCVPVQVLGPDFRGGQLTGVKDSLIK